MKPWTRDNTRAWIESLEYRIADIEYYLQRTLNWIETNEVYSDRLVFLCSFMTIVWVCHLRGEPISNHELFEILGIQNYDQVPDAIFQFNPEYEFMELEELLAKIIEDNSF